MARDEERLARSQQEPLVGGLPDVPGILTALRLTPALGVHLRGLADELLVDDFEGATISRAQREMLATAVSAANDCFYCMDSHGAFASALLERSEAVELLPLVDEIKNGSSDGFDPKMQALLHIARTVRREPLDLTAADVAAARRCRCIRPGRAARGAHCRRVLDVQPDRRGVPRPDRTDSRGLPGTSRRDRRTWLQRRARRRTSPGVPDRTDSTKGGEAHDRTHLHRSGRTAERSRLRRVPRDRRLVVPSPAVCRVRPHRLLRLLAVAARQPPRRRRGPPDRRELRAR